VGASVGAIVGVSVGDVDGAEVGEEEELGSRKFQNHSYDAHSTSNVLGICSFDSYNLPQVCIAARVCMVDSCYLHNQYQFRDHL
jgi:hypothetical protein